MVRIFFFILYFLPNSTCISTKVDIDKKEAMVAFNYLNDVRTNFNKYEKKFPFIDISNIHKSKLSWNDTLAKVAENKAFDMASRNYCKHVDPEGFGINYYINKSGYKLNKEWLKNKDENSFEAIWCGPNEATGEWIINNLIFDQGVPEFGHRQHLLGMNKWNASLVDIGIGFARRDSGSYYETYVCIIIGKHDW